MPKGKRYGKKASKGGLKGAGYTPATGAKLGAYPKRKKRK